MFYGMVNTRRNILKATLEKSPVTFMQQYKKIYMAQMRRFYHVHSEIEGFPHFMLWQPDATWADGVLSSQLVFDACAKHMANMTDTEAELFNPTICELLADHVIHRVQSYGNVLQIIATVDGERKQLLVNVMNMIDTESYGSQDAQHLELRDTIN